MQVGAGLQKLHESHGVRFYTNNEVVEIRGSISVEAVQLADGTILEVRVRLEYELYSEARLRRLFHIHEVPVTQLYIGVQRYIL